MLSPSEFGFEEGRFITPWITLWEYDRARMLTYLEFVFVYSGDSIKEIRHYTDYKEGQVPDHRNFDHLFITYSWEEYGEVDVELGLIALLLGGFALMVAMAVYIIIDLQLKAILADNESTSESSPSLSLGAFDFPTLGDTGYTGAIQRQIFSEEKGPQLGGEEGGTAREGVNEAKVWTVAEESEAEEATFVGEPSARPAEFLDQGGSVLTYREGPTNDKKDV
eukprot:TRINITY_DN2572_c1_g1_i1.p1 TRINITY_DN2572_c1_g1~~TRINITY_DN2572_c1_g1_i1.p1  ORF type:complete len:222 (-),score=27.26 TRINITY_DN2572_c1_g1_i1:176-841(-)